MTPARNPASEAGTYAFPPTLHVIRFAPEARARLHNGRWTNIKHNSALLVIQKRDPAHTIYQRAGP